MTFLSSIPETERSAYLLVEAVIGILAIQHSLPIPYMTPFL